MILRYPFHQATTPSPAFSQEALVINVCKVATLCYAKVDLSSATLYPCRRDGCKRNFFTTEARECHEKEHTTGTGEPQ
jgi:hypothetical protein